MDRLLRDAIGQLDLLTYDATGAPVDIDGSNAPAIVVTDSAGVATAAWTPSRVNVGTYKAIAPSNLEALDTYTAVWNFANGQTRTTQFELVGGFLFTIADVRALGTPLSNATTYPAAVVLAARAAVEDVFEDEKITNRAFRPRGRRFTSDSTGTDTLVVPDFDITRVVSASVDGGALTVSDVKVESGGTLRLKTGTWGLQPWIGTSGAQVQGVQNISVFYEYGFASPPAKVRREALKLAKSYLLESPLEEGRATAVFTDLGGYRLSIAGRDGWTGIPSVDACLAQYSFAPTVVVG